MNSVCPCCLQPVEGNDLLISEDKQNASRNGIVVHLAASSTTILGLLYKRYPGAVHREVIMGVLYGDNDDPPFEKTIDVFICRLRRLLLPLGLGISNSYGNGWRLLYLDKEEKAA